MILGGDTIYMPSSLGPFRGSQDFVAMMLVHNGRLLEPFRDSPSNTKNALVKMDASKEALSFYSIFHLAMLLFNAR